eukprot:g68483.t1
MAQSRLSFSLGFQFGITSRCAIATSKMIAIVKRKVAIKARDVVMVEEDAVAEHAVGVGVAVRFVVMDHAVRLVVVEHAVGLAVVNRAVVVRDAEFERAETQVQNQTFRLTLQKSELVLEETMPVATSKHRPPGWSGVKLSRRAAKSTN